MKDINQDALELLPNSLFHMMDLTRMRSLKRCRNNYWRCKNNYSINPADNVRTKWELDPLYSK
jgi:hypothetical protein